MRKFKVGDRVVANSSCSGVIKGREYTVKNGYFGGSHTDKLCIWDETNTKGDGCDCGTWTLVEAQYQPITPKVGEQYRVVKKYQGAGSIKVGDILTFISKGADGFCEWERDHTTYTPGTYTQILTTEYLELVEENQFFTVPNNYFEGLVNAISISTSGTDGIPATVITPGYHYYTSGAPAEPIKQSLITKTMNFIKKLTQSAADKSLEKAGFINSCGELTSLGQSALTSLVYQEKKDDLVKLAEEVIAEETK